MSDHDDIEPPHGVSPTDHVLTERAKAAGVEAIVLSPRLGDFNEDLHIFGLEALRAALRLQLVPKDVTRFLHPSTVATS